MVGGDGAGKTTLLRCVAGALAAAAGTVRRPGARRIGYLPPERRGVRRPHGGGEPAVPFGRLRDTGRGRPADRVGEYLERTGLAAARDRLAGQLSGGMRRKLGVIAAMLPEPGAARPRRADHRRRPGEPGRPVVAHRPRRRGRGGRADVHHLPGRGGARGARARPRRGPDPGRGHARPRSSRPMPGTIAVVPARPAGPGERRRAWRRAGHLAGLAARRRPRRPGPGWCRPTCRTRCASRRCAPNWRGRPNCEPGWTVADGLSRSPNAPAVTPGLRPVHRGRRGGPGGRPGRGGRACSAPTARARPP